MGMCIEEIEGSLYHIKRVLVEVEVEEMEMVG